MTTSILFIGAGRMAEAVFSGLLKQKPCPFSPIYVANRQNHAHLENLQSLYPIETLDRWEEVAANAEVIVLAMPPHAHEEVLERVSPYVDTQLIVTVAAGIGPSYLESKLPEGASTAWIMPNTAAQVGASMSLYAVGQTVTEVQRGWLANILAAIGFSEEMTEAQIHELTAITGSAPAFFYEFALQLEDAAKSFGISETLARKLVSNMLIGSAKMLEAEEDPLVLREQVTSPGGATAAGLASLSENDFSDVVHSAIVAVNARAREQGES
ncbi:pyrroline-5-carboxylate reductase [Shouchella shacheensis]|uniref:pyrroline-5-carboxylate reductase n=1 Tax=Shouchella shacheensis TaxID=1649580 RepID=UPI00073FB8F9|nr:pyrroline-5-carboxylate reductase [Shouchella shacheensis]